MDADDAVDVLETLPDDYREEIVARLDKEAREDIDLITSYDDDEIGSDMTTNFIVIKKGTDVKGAMRELIRQFFQGIHTQGFADEISHGPDMPGIQQVVDFQLAAFFRGKEIDG